MKLVKLTNIKGEIILESGLHIGAGDTEMHIGGTDNPVVTHPHTRAVSYTHLTLPTKA